MWNAKKKIDLVLLRSWLIVKLFHPSFVSCNRLVSPRRRRCRRWPRGASVGRAWRTEPRWAPARPRSPPTASSCTAFSTAQRRPVSLPTTTRPTPPPLLCPRPRPRRPTRKRRPGDTGSDSGTAPRRRRRLRASSHGRVSSSECLGKGVPGPLCI